MPIMAKKRSKGAGEPKKPNRTGTPLHGYIDPAISDALDAYVKATSKPLARVTKTEVIEAALTEWLTARGFPPSGGAASS
jgi:hypothetical protein